MLMMMGYTGTNGIEQGWAPDEKRINKCARDACDPLCIMTACVTCHVRTLARITHVLAMHGIKRRCSTNAGWSSLGATWMRRS